MATSMTGYAVRRGHGAGHGWTWDLRSVNGKGLDLRLRLPEGIEGLEPAVRAELTRALTRGNVSLTLKVQRDEDAAPALRVNRPALSAVLAALAEVEAAATQAGVPLARATQAEVLAVRGVLDLSAGDDDSAPLRAALMADLPALIDEFKANRAAEGAALGVALAGQVDRIASLTVAARAAAEARRETAADTLRAQVARVLADGVDAGRLAQELALLAVRADVTEELDRLTAHVAAARALLEDAAPVGRNLDFLMQEFMREANTLCSKAQAPALTRIGLDLKTVIDQMREQVQNLE